jgi:hypothetical protein
VDAESIELLRKAYELQPKQLMKCFKDFCQSLGSSLLN